jgi:formylglycine-generating enzyme
VTTAHRAIALFLALSACQVVGGYADFDYEAPRPLKPSHPCDPLPLVKDDAAGLTTMVRVDVPGARCVWIDRTEVTVEQYTRFQREVPNDEVTWEPTWCAWKVSRSDPAATANDTCRAELLDFDVQPFAPKKPIRCVDFCDAEAFCRWGGKHICYDLSGIGATGPRGFPQEWLLACTNGLTTRYPWGNETQVVCNTDQMPDRCIGQQATCGAYQVDKKPDCKNARGTSDLLGNVAEWVFACNFVDSEDPPGPTGCLVRGGGYDGPLAPCDLEQTLFNDTRTPSLGFRCCADLTPAEEEATLVSAATPP